MSTKISEVPTYLREMVINLHNDKENRRLTNRETGRRLKILNRTVYYIINRYKKAGTISKRPGRGRKKALIRRETKALIKEIKLNPKLSATMLKNQLKNNFNKSNITNCQNLPKIK